MYNLLPKNGHKSPLNLSEGVFKALALEKTLGGYSAALLGHDITDAQVEQIVEQGHKEVVLWPDPDKVGVLGMVGVAEKLIQEKIRTKIVYPFPSADADEMEEEEIWDCWENRLKPFSAMMGLLMKHKANCF
jgi:DNA primase